MNPKSEKYIRYRNQLLKNGWKHIDMLVPNELKDLIYQYRKALIEDYKDNKEHMKVYNRKTKQIEERIPKKSTLTKIREELAMEDTTELDVAQIDLPKVETKETIETNEVSEPKNPDPNHYSHFLNKDNEKLKADLIENNKQAWKESIDRVQNELKSRKNKQ